MNKSYSKIRHIQESNIKLETQRFNQLLESKMGDVRPLINEVTLDKKTFQMKSNNIFKCFNPTDYPNLWMLTKGGYHAVLGLLLMFLGAAAEAATWGASTVPSGAMMVAGATIDLGAYAEANMADPEKVKSELDKLSKCVFG